MWNFVWLDIDSSLQTNDSKWLDSSCDWTLTRLDQVVTLTRQKRLGHIAVVTKQMTNEKICVATEPSPESLR